MKNTMMQILARFLIALAVTTTTVANETYFHEFVVQADLVYSQADPICQMDLFIPAKATDDVPCVVVIQGGGFRAQTGKKFRPFAEHLAKHGIAAALIGYRGQPNHTYLDTMTDIKTAVRFVRKVSTEHGIDPDKIGAMGRSAGATIAALLAVTGNIREFTSASEHQEFSSQIQAVVGISGVYDFIARFADEEQRALQPNLDTKIISNGAWIDAPNSIDDEHWLLASAITHLDPTDPPMLLLHSRDDSTVPWPQSRNMHQALTDAEVEAEIYLSESGGHGGPADSNDRMVTFFQNVFSD